MRLRDLLRYDDIVIQCHDNPDADTLACGFALYRYLMEHGKKPRLVYSGNSYIRKSNLVMLVKDLEIPIEYVDNLDTPELLVMVDCQYTGGNVKLFPAENVAVIDHHRVSTQLPELSEVKSNRGSCSTLMWQLLKEEHYDVEHDKAIATALYYGLYTDTNNFTEIVHPLDKDLRDEAGFDQVLMTKYRNSNISLEELEVAGAALLHSDYLDAYRAALVKAGPCDPNVLGLISDLVLEVDAVDICIVFNIQPGGIKLSVRSCTKEVKASELVAELCKGIGSGGGHLLKAGGRIQMELMKEEYLRFCEKNHFTPRMELDGKGLAEQPTASGIKSVLEQRLRDYMDNTDIIYAADYEEEENLVEYDRRPIPWGYVRSTELAEKGTRLTIRSINGDQELEAKEDVFLIFGLDGEVRRVTEAALQGRYRSYPDWEFSLRKAEYCPTVKNHSTGIVMSPLGLTRVCVPKGHMTVYARKLERKVKLFPKGEEDSYLLGRVGDYLVSRTQNIQDAFIVERERFEQRYTRKTGDGAPQKALIFDLDGTLMDTLEDLKDAVNAALMTKGLSPCTLEQVRQYVGNGIRKLMIRAVPGGEEHPDFEEIFAAFKEYYDKHCLDHTAPYGGILPLLRELKNRQVPMAIVSNKVDSAVKKLNEMFFSEYISVAVGEMEGVARKPAPDMVEKALRELGVEKENAIYVGDSDVDLQTAENAGLPCVSVTWGFRDKEFLEEKGAKTFAQRPLELLYLL